MDNSPSSKPLSQPASETEQAAWRRVSLILLIVLGAAILGLLLLAAAIGGFGTWGSERLREQHALLPRLGAAVSGGLAAFVSCLAWNRACQCNLTCER